MMIKVLMIKIMIKTDNKNNGNKSNDKIMTIKNG